MKYLTSALQIENMKFKDKRMKIMNEMLNGIKVIYFVCYCLETVELSL